MLGTRSLSHATRGVPGATRGGARAAAGRASGVSPDDAMKTSWIGSSGSAGGLSWESGSEAVVAVGWFSEHDSDAKVCSSKSTWQLAHLPLDGERRIGHVRELRQVLDGAGGLVSASVAVLAVHDTPARRGHRREHRAASAGHAAKGDLWVLQKVPPPGKATCSACSSGGLRI